MSNDRDLWNDDLAGFEHDPLGDSPTADLAELESLIASAGRYVRPSDDLRPRVIEAARERAGQRRTRWKLTGAMAAAMLCILIGVSASHYLQPMADAAAMPRGERLEQMMVVQAAESGGAPDWALAEIIARWRSDLASRLADASSRSQRDRINRQNE